MSYTSSFVEGDDPPFLAIEPPHWAVGALGWLVIGLFATAAVASVLVRVPETVGGRFELVPVRGTDPVRALRHGQVTDVRVVEGQAVTAGAPLIVVRSDPVSDLAAELGGLQAQLRTADEAARNARQSYEARRRADEQDRAMLQAQLAALDRSIVLKQRQHDLAARLAASYERGYEHGSISGDEYTAREIDAQRLADELTTAQGSRAETGAAIEKLAHEMAARDADYRETTRRMAEDRERARLRAAALEQELGHSPGSQQVITAPCDGTVLRLLVQAPGAVVQEGEFVSEIACAGQRLQADLRVPAAGVDRVRAGQPVKLLYDAFPYQRFGVRHGRVRWVSPAASTLGDTGQGGGADSGFRALVDLDDVGIRVDGHQRALLPGMGGEARVVVARRSLVSYAFEPLRELRESLAGGSE